MVNFPTQISDCDSYSPTLLDLFLSSDACICSTIVFPPLEHSDNVAVSVSIEFPNNLKQDGLFHLIAAFDYSSADWDGLCDHLRDAPWEGIFILSTSIAASKFSHCVKIRSSITHLYGFSCLCCCHIS